MVDTELIIQLKCMSNLKFAELKLYKELVNLLKEKRNVVIDFSFWQRKKRNDYKKLIEDGGGEWRLIYLKVHPNDLRERLRIRSQRFDANAAFTITEEILSAFLKGFEVPTGEGKLSSSKRIINVN